MRIPHLRRRTLGLVAALVPLLALLAYVAARSGPLAPVAVTVGTVESRGITPALMGIGTVEARYTYRIGPTVAGRVKRLDVHAGDAVKAGQVLGEMDPVDLHDRIGAQQAAIKAAEAARQQAEARQAFARLQAGRYERLLEGRGTSEEVVDARRQELAVATAALAAVREEVARLHAEQDALHAQRANLLLVAPVAGLVAARDADPGTTVVAGQAVVEVIDPAHLWIDARLDQVHADGLVAGLPARITLRSRRMQDLPGRVLRIEPRADAVTEETLAKISFDTLPVPLPPLGELAEVVVHAAELPAGPTIPTAAVRTVDGRRGVWKLVDGNLAFTPVVLGRVDLEGRGQVLEGLAAGDRVVVYSDEALTRRSRIRIVEHLARHAP